MSSSGGSALSGAAQRVSRIVENIGGRTGRLISVVQCKSETLDRLEGYSVGQLRSGLVLSARCPLV